MLRLQNTRDNEYLLGIVERVTYHNPENGFCVLRVKVSKKMDLVTVVGNATCVSPGEHIQTRGGWCNDKNHGLQFKAAFLKTMPPNTLEGIEKYLGSGLIKGIGPHFAKQFVAVFKDEVFDIIEHRPELLTIVEGIGKVRAAIITNNWKDQKVIRDIMVFLQSHGVSTTKATRIYKTYGDKSIEVVSENPYRLAEDIHGIGFISADKIAEHLGIQKNSLIRARAGLAHVLLEATSDGHCGLPTELLISNSQKLLEIEQSIIEQAIMEEMKLKTLTADFLNNIETIFLTSYYVYEKHIASTLITLSKEQVPWGSIDSSKAIPWVEKKLNIKLADAQKIAIDEALQNKAMVITGGPGTGKTTLVNSILSILKAKRLNIKLCAPTGRAAKRLSEKTNIEALTIHRLLEMDPAIRKFRYNEENKLKCNYLVVDEASMVDVQLFYSLLKALPTESALLIVGDVDQLPSVGAGQVLKDIIDSDVIKTVRLNEIFRQAKTSHIITNAHLINKGIFPNLKVQHTPANSNTATCTGPDKETDFYFIDAEAGEGLMGKIINLVKNRIPSKFKFHPINDIQVLSPMQRGGAGVRTLNIELQKALNPNYVSGIEKYGQILATGDKVMQIENNYDKEVYNGDIGIIKSINQENHEVVINFDNREVDYDYSDLDQIILAYATTIHKSQGSEYPAVVIPLTMQSYMMLKRNLIYTAVTRAKNLIVIVGQRKALAIAVKNNKSTMRYTKLCEWLQLTNEQNKYRSNIVFN